MPDEHPIERQVRGHVDRIVSERLREGRERRRAEERRRYARVEGRRIEAIEAGEAAGGIAVYVRSFANGRVFVPGGDPLPVDTPVRMVFREVGGGPDVRAVGVVRWHARRAEDGGPGMGIEYLDVDSERNGHVVGLIRERLLPLGAWGFVPGR